MPSARLDKLRQHMTDVQCEAILVTNPLNVRYISGYTGSSGRLLITNDRSFIISDSRYELQCKIECPDFELELMTGRWEISAIGLAIMLNLSLLQFEGDSISYNEWNTITSALRGIEFTPSDGFIETMRMTKDAEEISMIREATQITDHAFSQVLKILRPGITELELAAEIDCQLRKCGAKKESFDTIAISGPRTALIHGQPTDREIRKGDLVLMDFGAFYKGYCSDMTRTVVMGKPTDKQQHLYRLVLEAQMRAIESIKPGKMGSEIDTVARNFLEEVGLGERFGHGLGHGLGLDIHDGILFSKYSTVRLEPGMVATVEPGIYIRDWGGIRIEDDVLITETGCEVLTSSPKQLTIE